MEDIKNISKCAYCGAALNSSHRISPVLIKCPNCDREFQVQDNLSKDIITKINLAHDKRKLYLFDEAYDLYNEIIKADSKNIEGHWGKFLCEYGIVYVHDETTNKYIPTMNRFLEEEVFINASYKKFINLVDYGLLAYYENEATYIEKIRQDILYHMKNKESFDVFICYKKSVTTEKGTLETTESRQARNIKELLSRSGYDKVFFAEETLKGTPGANWEAIIYTALKTSKVLLLMCSNDEYIRSAWVKNEWSRFAKLKELDSSKKIIPIGVDGYNFSRLPFSLKKYQGLTMQDTSFSTHLINYLNDVIPISIYEQVKRKQVNVVKERQIKDRQPVEIVSRKIGGKEINEYKITPTVEKELNNIKRIYISRKRFSKAIKRYNRLIQSDDNIHEAYWGIICATLEQTNFTLEDMDIKQDLTPIYNDFELLMRFKKEDVKIYLFYLSNHLKKMISNKQFNTDLFTFILSWKEYQEQLDFANEIYELFLDLIKNLDDSQQFYVKKYVLMILDSLTKILSEEENNIFFDRYLTIAEILLTKGYATISKKIIDLVLEIDELNSRALLVQLLLDLKVTDVSKLSEHITDKNFEIIFKKLLSSGYDALDIHKEILSGSFKLLEQNKIKKSVEVFDLYLSYYPDGKNDEVREVIKEYTTKLLLRKKFVLAEKYANHLLAVNPKDSYAHYIKFRIRLKASTHLDVLMNTKEELMMYPDFENMLNSDEDNEDALALYDAHDKLNQKTKEMKKFKKAIKKNYSVYNSYKSDRNLKDFLEEVYPEIMIDYQAMSKQTNDYLGQLKTNNLLLWFGLVYSVFFALTVNIVIPRLPQQSSSYVVVETIKSFLGTNLIFGVIILSLYVFIMTMTRNIKKKEFSPFAAISQTLTYVFVLLVIVIVGVTLPFFLGQALSFNIQLVKILFAIVFSVIPSLYAIRRVKKLSLDYPDLTLTQYSSKYFLKVSGIMVVTLIIMLLI